MINNIRIKNQPLFKEFTFHKQERDAYMVSERTSYDSDSLIGDHIPSSVREYRLSKFEVCILEKVFNYHTREDPLALGDRNPIMNEIDNILSVATDIVKVMSLDEVEFIEVDKETFDKWLTFREWFDIVGEGA